VWVPIPPCIELILNSKTNFKDMAKDLIKKSEKAKIILAYDKQGVNPIARPLAGKTVWEVYSEDTVGEIVDMQLGISTNVDGDGNPYKSLLLVTKDKTISVPFSTNFDHALLTPELIGDCQFYINKRRANATETKDNASGPEMLGLGKPAGISFASTPSLVGVTAEKQD
jgi:hypothetical protein